MNERIAQSQRWVSDIKSCPTNSIYWTRGWLRPCARHIVTSPGLSFLICQTEGWTPLGALATGAERQGAGPAPRWGPFLDLSRRLWAPQRNCFSSLGLSFPIWTEGSGGLTHAWAVEQVTRRVPGAHGQPRERQKQQQERHTRRQGRRCPRGGSHIGPRARALRGSEAGREGKARASAPLPSAPARRPRAAPAALAGGQAGP